MHWAVSRRFLSSLVVLGLLASAQVRAEEAVLELARLPDASSLVEVLWQRSPDLADARAKVGISQADVLRSTLLPNPTLDVALGGLPAGETNPPGLSVGQVVNASVMLSEQVELGKRGPRQSAASASHSAAVLDAREALRQKLLELQMRIAEVGSAEVRIAALSDAATDAARLTALQEARSGKGDTSGLDTDRARLEEQKVVSSLAEERAHLQESLRECARTAGVPCRPFGDATLAQTFIETVTHAESPPPPEQRPDLRSLEAQASAAQAQALLADRRAIPDPTFRVGYLKDQFVVSGNNPSTVFLGVSLPLPVFDHGQADAQAARVIAASAARVRGLLLEQTRRDRERLESQLAHAKERQLGLKEQTLPLARRVVDSLQKALLVGSPLQDLLLARRSLQELIIQKADVDLLVYRTCGELDRALGRAQPLPAELETP